MHRRHSISSPSYLLTEFFIVVVKNVQRSGFRRKTGLRELEVLRKLNEADREDRFHCLQLYRTFNHHNHLCLCFENLR
ncbi:hypothetical protein Y032_0237g3249 [Ancylostoma ceylanicum]|uniref:Uncharacterized protein n=1 Tax=Ancylostoma ceylanicum TaxID=53326 RepID=A0A016SFJ6_9BILA|nr:hypothetical protein Y032_0237g3249 [Ancylostoma ceylanicum]